MPDLGKLPAQADEGTDIPPNEVSFLKSSDPDDPLQWPLRKKVAIVLNVSLLAAVGQMSSSMVAPAIGQIIAEFESQNEQLAVFVVSVFPLGMAVGLLLISGLSEVYGRVAVFTTMNVLFVIFAIATALSASLGQLIGFRFLLGFAASAPPSIGGGVIGDMFIPQQRGRATSVYAFGNLIGPLLGPVVGGYLAQSEGWRWVCWLTAILVRGTYVVNRHRLTLS
jgi:MFS family permease